MIKINTLENYLSVSRVRKSAERHGKQNKLFDRSLIATLDFLSNANLPQNSIIHSVFK